MIFTKKHLFLVDGGWERGGEKKGSIKRGFYKFNSILHWNFALSSESNLRFLKMSAQALNIFLAIFFLGRVFGQGICK